MVLIFKTGEALLAETYSSSGVQDAENNERHWTHRMVGRDWRLRGASCCVHCGGSKHAAEKDPMAAPLMLFVCGGQHQQLLP